jgi:hypothetical protein
MTMFMAFMVAKGDLSIIKGLNPFIFLEYDTNGFWKSFKYSREDVNSIIWHIITLLHHFKILDIGAESVANPH